MHPLRWKYEATASAGNKAIAAAACGFAGFFFERRWRPLHRRPESPCPERERYDQNCKQGAKLVPGVHAVPVEIAPLG